MLCNLTTLANLRAWIGAGDGSDDIVLKSLIASTSRTILSWIQRPNIFQTNYSEVYDGAGTTRIYLRNYPVLSVTQVVNGYQTIFPFIIPPLPAPSTQCGSGFIIDPWGGAPPGRPQALTLRGNFFCRGQSNVSVTYAAGYAVQNEAHVVPASSSSSVPSVRVSQPYGNWGQDQGVTYASSGAALTGTYYNEVTVANLASGNYMYKADGTYYFASADAAANVLISYSFVPADLEQACIETITERYKYRDRVGQKSKSLAGQETVTYDNSGLTKYATMLIQPYKRCTFA